MLLLGILKTTLAQFAAWFRPCDLTNFVKRTTLAALLLFQFHATAQSQNINPGVPWPATDGLGRSLPMAGEVPTPRPDRFIGMFYFLCLGRHGEEGPFDIGKILAKDPSSLTNGSSPLWGPPNGPMHHWGEPLLDYYVAEDPFVLRKHAQ
jgi:hypothetical protein